ncbi:hypothetical protein [Pseudonocardia sp. SID8383]|uniref:hypothetical protein n=1 Tax=Pseudonocardia sp. SID8383 TaxID=2690363 RepID=UPI0013693731|nr:hypothetical protein [Pseudonocardia sp. SID8383]MYW72226.1 hypothetical protein [Pseudonocardia sp. SID8383]
MTATATTKGRARARSTTVRGTVVTGTPSTTVISSATSVAAWNRADGAVRAPLRRFLVTSTRSSGTRHSPIPCIAAAETWLDTASGDRVRTAARTVCRCRSTGPRSPAPT